MKTLTIATVLLTFTLSACATPKPVRELAASTGSLVAETQGTATVVQKRFREQDAIVQRRVEYWNDHAAGFRGRTNVPTSLWSADAAGEDGPAARAKVKQRFLDLVRARDGERSSAPMILQPGTPDAVKLSSAKLMLLLDEISKGRLTTPETVSAWLQATDKSLSDLKKDAEQ